MPYVRRLALAASVAALTALAAPGLAGAGTVSYTSANVLSYAAAAGEVNKLTISINANRVVYTEDGGINIAEAEADCDGNGTPVVSCKIDHNPAALVFFAGANLADMDDRATAALPADSTINVGFSGGAGADELDGTQSASASLSGDAGADTLTAGRGSNFVAGGDDADIEIGGPVDSTTEFSQGSTGPNGADDIRGGPGLDILSYEGRTAPVTAAANDTPTSGEAGEGDKIAPAVEALQGGSTDDTITASSAVDGSLSGYGGNDHLIGGSGDDTLFGGEGNDSMEGGPGNDTAASADRRGAAIGGGPNADLGADSFSGGEGFDTIDYSTRIATVLVSVNGMPDDGEANEGDNTGADVEEFIGGRGPDSLSGDDDDERLIGGSGNDRLAPAGGVDFVAGGGGDDSIAAQDDEADLLACGVGTDTVSADFFDELDSCEMQTILPEPPPDDETKPTIKFTGLSLKPKFKALVKGLRFRLGANEPASFVVVLEGTARRATVTRAAFNLTLATRKLKRGSGARLVKLKPKRALLGKPRRLKLRLRVTATDAAGNTRAVKRTLRVRRR